MLQDPVTLSHIPHHHFLAKKEIDYILPMLESFMKENKTLE